MKFPTRILTLMSSHTVTRAIHLHTKVYDIWSRQGFTVLIVNMFEGSDYQKNNILKMCGSRKCPYPRGRVA